MPNALLALETSGNLGSVAVAVGGEVRARRFLAEPRAHASAIVGAIDAVLMAAGITRQALGGVVVGSGPGSFTGVRVAAATGKGLAHALGCPMWAASSLAAGALTPEALPPGAGPWAAPAPGDLPSRRGVLFDARGRRLFAAAFEVSGVRSKVILDPRFLTLDELLGDDAWQGLALCGDGCESHRSELSADGRVLLPPPFGVPTADALLAGVLAGAVAPLDEPYDWEPTYLRATSAERLLGDSGKPVG